MCKRGFLFTRRFASLLWKGMSRPTRFCEKCGEYVAERRVTTRRSFSRPLTPELRLVHISADGAIIHRSHKAVENVVSIEMARKKSALERKLEDSIKLVKRGQFPKKDSLERRLRRMDDADMPDSLDGDEAFPKEEDRG